MPSACRIGDTHRCAIHAGGRIISGCPTVVIGDAPAARVTDVAECSAPEEDTIEDGCATVTIGSQRAARVYDATDGGYLTSGERTVLVGPSLSPNAVKAAIRRARRAARG